MSTSNATFERNKVRRSAVEAGEKSRREGHQEKSRRACFCPLRVVGERDEIKLRRERLHAQSRRFTEVRSAHAAVVRRMKTAMS